MQAHRQNLMRKLGFQNCVCRNFSQIIVEESSKVVEAPKLLLPMPEHPIFPGYNNQLSINEEQYTILKDHDEVFASVITDQKIVNDQKTAQKLM